MAYPVHITQISPQSGKVEGGEYIRIQGNGFNREMYCKFDDTRATTFYSDSNNLFCKSPPSNNFKVGPAFIYLCIKDAALNHNEIKFEYIISKEKEYLLSFNDKLNKVNKMPFDTSVKTKTQELIDHSQDIIDNLEELRSDCSLNERLTKLNTEFQVLISDMKSQSNSKDVEKNSMSITQELSELKLSS